MGCSWDSRSLGATALLAALALPLEFRNRDPALSVEPPRQAPWVFAPGRLLAEHDSVWTQVSCPERLSRSGPPGYDDVVPFARHLVERFPDRVRWGTDGPHPNLTHHMPDDGELVDAIPRIAPTAELPHELLVENPMRLYWGDPAPTSP